MISGWPLWMLLLGTAATTTSESGLDKRETVSSAPFIVISSIGEAQKKFPELMGVYEKTDEVKKGVPVIYKHVDGHGYVFLLKDSWYGRVDFIWKINRVVGNGYSSALYTKDYISSMSPPSTGWMVGGRRWQPDNTIQITTSSQPAVRLLTTDPSNEHVLAACTDYLDKTKYLHANHGSLLGETDCIKVNVDLSVLDQDILVLPGSLFLTKSKKLDEEMTKELNDSAQEKIFTNHQNAVASFTKTNGVVEGIVKYNDEEQKTFLLEPCGEGKEATCYVWRRQIVHMANTGADAFRHLKTLKVGDKRSRALMELGKHDNTTIAEISVQFYTSCEFDETTSDPEAWIDELLTNTNLGFEKNQVPIRFIKHCTEKSTLHDDECHNCEPLLSRFLRYKPLTGLFFNSADIAVLLQLKNPQVCGETSFGEFNLPYMRLSKHCTPASDAMAHEFGHINGIEHGGWSTDQSLNVAVQSFLSKKGIFTGKVDGNWGESTWKALQKFLKLTPTGAYGPETVEALKTYLNSQKKYRLRINSEFDEDTKAALYAFVNGMKSSLETDVIQDSDYKEGIVVTSTGSAQEKYPKLMGAYKQIDIYNNHAVYKQVSGSAVMWFIGGVKQNWNINPRGDYKGRAGANLYAKAVGVESFPPSTGWMVHQSGWILKPGKKWGDKDGSIWVSRWIEDPTLKVTVAANQAKRKGFPNEYTLMGRTGSNAMAISNANINFPNTDIKLGDETLFGGNNAKTLIENRFHFSALRNEANKCATEKPKCGPRIYPAFMKCVQKNAAYAFGGDRINAMQVTSPQECYDKCQGDWNCTHWTWYNRQNSDASKQSKCYLGNTKTRIYPKTVQNAVSGPKKCE